MDVIDYNGEGRWSRAEILARYFQYAAEMGIVPRDLSLWNIRNQAATGFTR